MMIILHNIKSSVIHYGLRKEPNIDGNVYKGRAYNFLITLLILKLQRSGIYTHKSV